jgi:hypothetical protein
VPQRWDRAHARGCGGGGRAGDAEGARALAGRGGLSEVGLAVAAAHEEGGVHGAQQRNERLELVHLNLPAKRDFINPLAKIQV